MSDPVGSIQAEVWVAACRTDRALISSVPRDEDEKLSLLVGGTGHGRRGGNRRGAGADDSSGTNHNCIAEANTRACLPSMFFCQSVLAARVQLVRSACF